MAKKKQEQRGRSSARTQSRTQSRTSSRSKSGTGTGKSAPQRAAPARGQSQKAGDRRESGSPGGGQGRRDVVGGSKVYPASGGPAPADAEIRDMASWGQGKRGAEGYFDSGGSELVPRDGQLLGGLDVGPSGAPITDLPPEGDESDVTRPPDEEKRR